MTDKLLKIVFIEKSETIELKSLNNVFAEITTCYKFVKDEVEINELISNLENDEKLVCRYIDGVLYVEGLRKKLAENYADTIHSLAEAIQQSKEVVDSWQEFLFKEEYSPNEELQSNEKDIIDKLAEKYKKEAEDKGRLN